MQLQPRGSWSADNFAEECEQDSPHHLSSCCPGGLRSDHKIKHAIKLKTCTTVAGRYAVIACKPKQNANEGCNSCANLAGLVLSFIACFILLVIAPLRVM